jgi:hypothetical protein
LKIDAGIGSREEGDEGIGSNEEGEMVMVGHGYVDEVIFREEVSEGLVDLIKRRRKTGTLQHDVLLPYV